MAGDRIGMLNEVATLPADQRAARLVEVIRGGSAIEELEGEPDARARLVELLAALIADGGGTSKERVILGEALGRLGDPRLRLPSDADYWVTVPAEHGEIVIGRNLVTNHEFGLWAESGGYQAREHWSDEGWAWLQGCEDPWPVRARAEGSEPFVVTNQPVVGVTWWEAEAYAAAMDARLPHADERVWVIRGRERRPYPWGSPFGEGHANTREEVIGRPCAVGLFLGDRTPEGVCDLAGNAAEWTADGVGNERLIHPGAWDQPSMAAWAKALAMVAPDNRWAGLGFRLARDA